MSLLVLILALLSLRLLSSPAPALAAEASTLYPLPSATHAGSLVPAPDGSLSFIGYQATGSPFQGREFVGRFESGSIVDRFDLPDGLSAGQMIEGPGGDLWFTETAENAKNYHVARIGRLSPAGDFTQYPLGNRVGSVNSLAVGPEKAIWFTTAYRVSGETRRAIGRIGPTGAVTRFPLPAHIYPHKIALGPDGNLWFTEKRAIRPAGLIGRIDPHGAITQFPLPDANRIPAAIVLGLGGHDLWFTEAAASGFVRHPMTKIGRITPRGVIEEFSVPGGDRSYAATYDLVAGPQGKIWFTTRLPNRVVGIASIDAKGEVSGPTCLAPSCELEPATLASTPDGSLWFTVHKFYPHGGGGGTGLAEDIEEEREAGYIGRFVPPSQSIAVEPPGVEILK